MDAELIMRECLAKEIDASRSKSTEEVLPEHDELVDGRRRRDLVAGGAPLNAGRDEARNFVLLQGGLGQSRSVPVDIVDLS